METTTVAINKTTDTTTMPVHQIYNKTETTQMNNHVDIVTEQITGPEIVKPFLTAEDSDTCLANVEQHDRIKAMCIKIRMLTKTGKITTNTATQVLSNKIL